MSQDLERPVPAGLVVNLVVDFVCPWCLIGSRRLELALEEAGKELALPEVRVVHHPFLLDETTPPEGRDLRAHLAQKYGGQPEAMFARVEEAAKASGIELDFAKVRRMSSTLKAHTLVQNALERGTQRALVRAIYEAYFFEGRDIGDDAVLVDLATRHGFEEAEVRALLADETEIEESRKEARTASAQGISGVPFFIFGDKFAVSGAQSVPVLVEAIRRAVTQPPVSASPHSSLG